MGGAKVGFQVDRDASRTGEQDLAAQFYPCWNLCVRTVHIFRVRQISVWKLRSLVTPERCCVLETNLIDSVLGALWLRPDTRRLPFDLQGIFMTFTTPPLLHADGVISSPPIHNLRILNPAPLQLASSRLANSVWVFARRKRHKVTPSILHAQ